MVKVDSEKCIGCGMCISLCDQVFELDEETHKSKVKSDKNLPCVKEAMGVCPVEAIEE